MTSDNLKVKLVKVLIISLMVWFKGLKMQKRTEEKLNKVKLLIDRGITDQRTISNMLNISLPTVNKLCQYITKGIEKRVKETDDRRKRRERRKKEVAIIQLAKKEVEEKPSEVLFEDMFKNAVVALTARLDSMEDVTLVNLVLKVAEMVKGGGD